MSNLIDLKERIALAEGFTPEEATFILAAVDAAVDAVDLVGQGEKQIAEAAGRAIALHYHLLLAKAGAERDELYDRVADLLVLLELVRGRDDMPPEISDILKTHYAAVDAAAYLTQILPPRRKC